MVCSLEFPDIESQIWQPYQAQGVAVIGASGSNGDTNASVQLFVEQGGLTFPVGFDANNSIQTFRVPGDAISPFPLDVIIDQEGIVRYVAVEVDIDAMTAVIDALLLAP